MRFPKVNDPTCGMCRFVCGLDNAPKKELEPPFPVSLLADGSEPIIVFRTIPLQVIADVEERSVENFSMTEKERDKQPSNTPIAIEKGMNRLELCMSQSTLDKSGQAVVV